MKKVLFITNIPSPYRIAFYSLLGHYVDLTVIFEARGASGIKF
ncbi:TPA: glycosyltransferase family 1 protein, partial [Streptococcus suis]|nr:glycosyltransferase family 1 protein [Streptococcus suis]